MQTDYDDHVSYRAELRTFGYFPPEEPGPMPRELREAIEEHNFMVGVTLEQAEKDRAEFEQDAERNAEAMRRGANRAFEMAADLARNAGNNKLARKFESFAKGILNKPLSELEEW